MEVLASGYPSLDYIIPVSHSPEVGSTALILCDVPDELVPTMGGCGANVAVGLRRLGFTAGVAAVIGDDRRGRHYRAQLAEERVDLRNLIVLPQAYTSFSYLFRNPAGEYQNFFYAGAADAWSGDLMLTGLEGLRWGLVTVGAYEHNRQFVEQIAARGIALAWQLKPDIFAYPPGAIAEFAQRSALILMNRIEAEFVTAALGLSSVEALLSPVTRCVVVTRGAAGADVLTAEGCWHVDAIPADVVDPVGAGDGFTAGFLAGMLRGDAPPQCARWGVVVASFVVEAIGCQTRLPTWEQVEARSKEHFGQ